MTLLAAIAPAQRLPNLEKVYAWPPLCLYRKLRPALVLIANGALGQLREQSPNDPPVTLTNTGG